MSNPLADRLRPNELDDVVGQEHLIGKGKILRKIIDSKNIPNMIFYGPSGTGKTTIANIIANNTGKRLYKLNATNAAVADIKAIIKELDSFMSMNGVLLYLDEIQNFNKKQQQSLLEFIENGKITLIASTTENPYFYIYNAILSRSSVFEFKQVGADDIEMAVKRAIVALTDEYEQEIVFDDNAITHIAHISFGDVRKALNVCEIAVNTCTPDESHQLHVTLELAEACSQKKSLRYDKNGDSHYDILSAFQKSIRGSDVNASVHYLARLICAGDLASITRRMLVIAAEDVGLAYPQSYPVVKACVDAAFQLGLPEARIPLAEAVILLASAPKSNSAMCAIDAAIADIENVDTGDIPASLKDGHYPGAKTLGNAQGYIYPHGRENNYVKQQYLPDNIRNRVYYKSGNNKLEQAANKYLEMIKSDK